MKAPMLTFDSKHEWALSCHPSCFHLAQWNKTKLKPLFLFDSKYDSQCVPLSEWINGILTVRPYSLEFYNMLKIYKKNANVNI